MRTTRRRASAPTRLTASVTAALLALSACAPAALPPSTGEAPAALGAGLRPVPDTWEDVHAFLVFDGRVDYRPGAAYSRHRYDFIWAAGHVVEPRRGASRGAVLGGYMPGNRDPRAHTPTFDHRDHTLAWYQRFHPDWVVYRCPRGVEPTDPATAQPAFFFDDDGQRLVPLDITNPEVARFQIAHHGRHTSRAKVPDGYDALGVDNVYLFNVFGLCGVFRGGRFVRLHRPEVPRDPAFCADVAAWLGRLRDGLRALSPPVRLVANVAPILDAELACFERVVDNLDGLLDEGGFMRPDLRTPPTEQDWLARVRRMVDVQRRGRAYYLLSEFAAPPSPKDFCAQVVSPAQIEWSLASYLMGKERSAALFISGLQQYGCPLWYPELDARVGHPCGDLRRRSGAWVRDYSRGLVAVNASAERATLPLPGGALRDLAGARVGGELPLAPHTGRVLVTPEGAPDRCR